MDNKVLVKLTIPEIETSYNVYLPISKRIGNIIILLIKAINESGLNYPEDINKALYNRETGEKYGANKILYETDIRNGTEIILL